MALFEDDVVLTLGGEETRIVENYEVRSSILTQPAGFSLRLGHGGVIDALARQVPPQTPFELRVNGQLLQTGYTDGLRTAGSGGTQITFDGRDAMGRLVSAYAPVDRSFSNLTYAELVKKILGEVGFTIDGEDESKPETLLFYDDTANRKAISGTKITTFTNAEIETTTRANQGTVTDEKANTKKTTYSNASVKVGRRWYEWLKTQLDRAGLFMWAAATGDFILTVPNASQAPAYRLTRARRGAPVLGKVTDHSFELNTTERYSKIIVYGRGGGQKTGRHKFSGEFIDSEMAELFGGQNAKIYPIHDNEVTNAQQAVHYARRRMAELNREGWSLTYTVSGHSTTDTADGRRAIWTPNTVVEVADDELGLYGNLWVEEVSLLGTPQRTTRLRLMRPRDLFFATELQKGLKEFVEFKNPKTGATRAIGASF